MADGNSLPVFIPGPRLIDGSDLNRMQAALGAQTITIPVPAMSALANAQVLQVAVPFPFKVVSAGFRVFTAVTTGAKLATLTTQVNGVSVTGGVIALTSANSTPSGTLVAGSAITAGNTASVSGQTIGAVVSAVTAFSEGSGQLEFTIQHI